MSIEILFVGEYFRTSIATALLAFLFQLNDKDLGMLEERIKRASRSKPVPVATESAPSTSSRSSSKSRPSTAPSQSSPAKDTHSETR